MRENLTVSTDETPLDLLLWRRYGREVPGLVEGTYDINQDLAREETYLPVGRSIAVDIPEPVAPSPVRLVRLSD